MVIAVVLFQASSPEFPSLEELLLFSGEMPVGSACDDDSYMTGLEPAPLQIADEGDEQRNRTPIPRQVGHEDEYIVAGEQELFEGRRTYRLPADPFERRLDIFFNGAIGRNQEINRCVVGDSYASRVVAVWQINIHWGSFV